jgi:hypothetical protein
VAELADALDLGLEKNDFGKTAIGNGSSKTDRF